MASAVLSLISDILSLITIALCLILKVPQILRLIKSGKAAGLSLNGLLLELSSYTVTMMYNYTNNHALLSYLEYPIIVFQEYVLIYFVMHYKKFEKSKIAILIVGYLLISLAFAYNILSKMILTVLLPLTTPVSAFSKIIQLVEIVSKGNADSVSALTWFLSLFSNVTRIYTVYMDSGDFYLLMNFSVSSVLSGCVLAAALYYQRIKKRG